MSGLIQRELYDRVVAERDDLAERLRWHEEAWEPPPLWGARLGLTRQQARLLHALAERSPQVVRTSAALTALGSNANDASLKTVVCKVREILGARGFKPGWIITHWGRGYSLSEEGRAWLQQPARAERRA